MPKPPPDASVRHTSSGEMSLGEAALVWMAGWAVGNIAASIVLAMSGQADVASAHRPVWLSTSMALAIWVPQLVALAVAARMFASGRPIRDYSLRFARIDLLGIPIGIVSQLLLLRAIYWPLHTAWPERFSDDQLEKNARELYDTAKGGWVVLLIVVIVVGAPLVDELVYRGLLQTAARRRFPGWVAVVGVAAFFALIHFRWVEYPGLFAFGLVLGSCAFVTRRLGMSILAHVAFNATALFMVAR